MVLSSLPGFLTMASHRCRTPPTFFSNGFAFAGATVLGVLALWAFMSFLTPGSGSDFDAGRKSTAFNGVEEKQECSDGSQGFDRLHDPPEKNFYDDPKLSYTIDKPIKNWDEKRKEWLEQHPSFIPGADNRILMVTGSQATPCRNPIGDHLLLRLFKNKVDYCRIHGYDFFYNNVLLQPVMFSFWAKVPTVRAAMLAHPEAEWIWWVDSDAAITDMDFKLPLHRYKNHNLVVHGWLTLVEKSWTSVNAGVFLIRNCQWSMDFMDVWANMGPQSPEYDDWGKTLHTTFPDKETPEADDQSGLIYLISKEKQKWGNKMKIFVESEYYFEGYWLEIVGKLENITDGYLEIEKREPKLRRRHAEKVSESYAMAWEEHLKDAGYGRYSWRRPFITHFTGCQPCTGDRNQAYSGEVCVDSMHKALNFADNQVLRRYGYMHKDLLDTSSVVPLGFDFPA
ncbi:PREDICTED: galactomannan galactosyltransferase 1-like [Ipomoea nil]|uniref:galactomannan galactosyltransferase 1-like n=1 Tax=Ipomoea nil TaxID=35883 RepID=UPI0009012A97|nr:PREDICTED: galactomannan galactosyltransferase 1-like [Ipomoea nil]